MSAWEDQRLKFVLELSAAGAVLIGLLFVGVELKQNTEAVQATTMQAMTEASQQYLLLIASDPELTRIWRLANEDPHALNEEDATRYFFLLRAQWLRFQNAFLQWQRGTMSDVDWALYENFVCDLSVSTTAQSRRLLWSEHGPSLTTEFAEFVESCWAADRP